MILGMSVSTFTTLHVLISLVAIATGLIVRLGHAGRQPGEQPDFRLPADDRAHDADRVPVSDHRLHPGARAWASCRASSCWSRWLALYAFRLRGPWRWIYVGGAVLSLYLNVFVLVVQSFLKVPALNALAPDGNEPPFAITQGILLVASSCRILSLRRFHPSPDPNEFPLHRRPPATRASSTSPFPFDSQSRLLKAAPHGIPRHWQKTSTRRWRAAAPSRSSRTRTPARRR